MNETVRVLPDDEHNRTLLANAHPAGHVNPEPAPKYNLVVIGAGTGGLVTAAGGAGLGAKVALIERHLMGGDCLNVGCVPSKALIRAARAWADVRDAGSFGVRVPAGAQVDFGAVMERMRRLRARIAPNDGVPRFAGLGIDVFLGAARFTGPDAVEVGGKTLRFVRAVIATGGRPAVPDLPGLKEAGYRTNENVFELTERPARLAVIGGGPIGCELAQAFQRFGSEVTLVQSHERILPREDREAAGLLEKALLRDGLKLYLGTRALRVEQRADGKALELETPAGKTTLVVDEILVAAGRRANVEGLGLERAGVAFDARTGVAVDDRLRTTNPSVYAAGDVCSRHQFTHTADANARIVLRNALFCGRARVSALTVPWCTYTDPEIAHVGLTEHEARERGIPTRAFVQPLHEVDRAILDGQEEGFVKVIVREGSDRILGATIVAAHAGDMISEITVAMVGGVGLGTLGNAIHPYPTQAEAIKRCADAYGRTRLTPFVRRMFEAWLKWKRE